MNLYIDLIKATSTSGEQRGGKYVARVESGTNNKGKTQYHYFKTVEEYKAHLDNQSKAKKEDNGKKKKKNLKDKLESEHKEKPGPKKTSSLFLKKDK